MTKREEWEKMIDGVQNDSVSKEEILRFLKANQPKPKESRKKLPCICGCKNVHIWYSTPKREFFCRCSACDKEAVGDKREIQAIRNWNEMIRKELENNGSEN